MTAAESQPKLVDVSQPVAAARARLTAISGLHKRFGVIRLWPELQVAEHECIERLRRAAAMIGAQVVDLDRYSRPLQTADAGELDFILNLHFDSPKCTADISIGALWNPLQFYFDFGFERVWSNQMSHDLFAWTGADQIQRLVAAERGSAAEWMAPLNHTIAEPLFVPTAKTRYDAFYCGINWERLSARKGRHHEFLSALDRIGRLRAYGPSEMRGVRVWEGFAGYRGPLPFDGHSVVRKAWECGATLVLSSEAHKASGIMSNRFFEAAAAGSVILGDDHPFIRQAAGDAWVQIPQELSDAKRAAFVDDVLADFEKNPGRAVALARAAQSRLIDSYFLCSQIAGLFEAADKLRQRQHAPARTPATRKRTDIVVQALGRDAAQLEHYATDLHANFGDAANIIIVAGKESSGLRRIADVTVVDSSAFASDRMLDIISTFNAVRHALISQKVIFALGIERYLGNAAAIAAEAFPPNSIGRLGFVAKHHHEGQEHYTYFSDINTHDFPDTAAIGSYVFDREWLTENSSRPAFTPKGLTRLAAHSGSPLGISYPTALQVDLIAWQALVDGGHAPTNWFGQQDAFVDRVAAKQTDVNGDVFVIPPGAASSFYPPGGTIEAALNSLRPEARLNLARGLFEALPIPAWSKRVLRMIRRRL